MSGRVFLLILFAAGGVIAGGQASAQDVAMPAETVAQVMPEPAHISGIDGAATLIRDGRADPAALNMPLLEGDELGTASGRLEVMLPDGSLLHLDQFTTVDLLSAALMRLSNGRLIFVVTGRPDEAPALEYQVDAPAGSVWIIRPGEYRVSIVQGQRAQDLELDVVRGEATLAGEEDSVQVRAGEQAFVTEGLAPSYPQPFNSARADAFVRWSDDRRNARVGYASSRQYLPSEVQVYASTFDRYGSWDYSSDYGNVWYPTVGVDWRPYYDGVWRPLGYYGWTWIGYDPWCWPTHHYGRWGFGVRGWFWIPGRSWASAWVSWAFGNSYVSWCPLGWDNRPVFSLNVAAHYFGGRRYDAWYGWTAVPRRSFGLAQRVAGIAVPRNEFGGLRTDLRAQGGPPPLPAGIAARPLAGGNRITGLTGRAVPRGPVGPAAGGWNTAPLQGSRLGGSSVPRDGSRLSAPRAVEPGVQPNRSGAAIARSPAARAGLPAANPQPSRTGAPQAFERRSTAPTMVPRSGERTLPVQPRSAPAAQAGPRRTPAPATIPQTQMRSYSSQPRSSAGAGAVERRAPVQTTIPRSSDRSSATVPRSPVGGGAVQRRAPEQAPMPQVQMRSYSSQPRSYAGAGAIERRAPTSMSAPRAPVRESAPSVSRAPSAPRAVAPPAVSRSRPQSSSGQARSRAPQQSAPRRR